MNKLRGTNKMIKDETIQNYNKIFWNHVIKYDTSNSNILRKIIHSYSVAEKCYSIACKFMLNKEQRNFCYLIGLFHDIGRFEQWKLYQTYNDKKSGDHGDIGASILDKYSNDIFNITDRQKEIMIEAIKWHTKTYKNNDEEVKFYNEIIKNADAYSNIITTANGAQPMTMTEDGYTKEILNDFLELKPLWIYSPNTKLDCALALTACTYYVKYSFLQKEIIEKNYIDIIYETFSQYLNNEDKEIYKNAIESLKFKLVNN